MGASLVALVGAAVLSVAVGAAVADRGTRRRAAALGPAPGRRAAGTGIGRLRRRAGPPGEARDRSGGRRLLRPAPWAVAAGAAVLIGGAAGAVTGLLLGVAVHLGSARLSRGAPAPDRTDRLLRQQLPLTAELLAACLAASGPPSDAAAAVARAVGSPMRERLAGVAAELRMGADPADCWERLADGCPALLPLGRCLGRAGTTGAPPAATLARLAEEERSAATRAATARTRRAGVLATAPLGGCFLPAFVLIGIVPVLTGLASSFLGRR